MTPREDEDALKQCTDSIRQEPREFPQPGPHRSPLTFTLITLGSSLLRVPRSYRAASRPVSHTGLVDAQDNFHTTINQPQCKKETDCLYQVSRGSPQGDPHQVSTNSPSLIPTPPSRLARHSQRAVSEPISTASHHPCITNSTPIPLIQPPTVLPTTPHRPCNQSTSWNLEFAKVSLPSVPGKIASVSGSATNPRVRVRRSGEAWWSGWDVTELFRKGIVLDLEGSLKPIEQPLPTHKEATEGFSPTPLRYRHRLDVTLPDGPPRAVKPAVNSDGHEASCNREIDSVIVRGSSALGPSCPLLHRQPAALLPVTNNYQPSLPSSGLDSES
jgi:hypothetical protein